MPVDVVHSEGTATVLVDQRSGGGQWNVLGTFAFEADTASITIRTDDTDG